MMVPDNDRLDGRIGSSLPVYAFNDTFDEKNLTKNLYWSLNRLYTRALEGQRGLCHILRYNGHFSDFKIDSRVNNVFDLPYNTYTVKIPLNVINFFSSKAAKEINYSLRIQADFWRNGDETIRQKNAARKIQDKIWRCTKTTNVLWDGESPNPMHTPDYYYDRDHKYIVRDLCATTLNGVRYLIDKASYPYIYSIQETYAMPKLFTHHFMVFINGYIFSDAKFFCDNNFIYVFICTNNPSDETYANDLINENIVKQWIKDDVPFTIMGFPFSTTRGYMGTTHDSELVSDEGLNYDLFTEDFTGNMQFRNNVWLMGYSDPSVSTFFLKPTIAKLKKDSHQDPRYVSMTDYKDFQYRFSSMDRVYIEAFNLKHACGISNIGISREFFIPLTKNGRNLNPVPPQNIMIFEYTDNGEMRFVHNAYLSLYFPNVYIVRDIDPNKKLCVMWFNNYEDITDHNIFDNPLKNYMKYNENYSSSLIYGTLPAVVAEYIPAAVSYDYDDYFIYRRSMKSNHNEYMIEKISEVMKDNPERFEYIYTSLMEKTSFKLHANPKQVLYLKEIPGFNLDDITCTTNIAVCKPYDVPITFKIPHACFRIEHHENTSYSYAVWVDGILQHVPYLYDVNFTTWIYLPIEVLHDASTLEVEMMRVTGRGRIQAEIDFVDVDTSIELPHVFEDVSPQSIMISIQKRLTGEKIILDRDKSYTKYITNSVPFAEWPKDENDNPIYDQGATLYRVAPDYEMSWVLFGYNRYADGVLTSGIPTNYHKTEIIEYPFFDEDGKPKVSYVEREKCKHVSLEELYGTPQNIDWTVGSTIMTDVKDDLRTAYANAYPRKTEPVTLSKITDEILNAYKLRYPKRQATDDGVLEESEEEWYVRLVEQIEKEEPHVYVETEEEFQARVDAYMNRHSDSSILIPLNVAMSRDYYKTADNSYFVTALDTPWPNGFYALDRRRFYQYLPYGENASPIYITPIGKPTRAEAVQTIAKYVRTGDIVMDYIHMADTPIRDNEIVYFNPSTSRWSGINYNECAENYEETWTPGIITASDVKLAIAKGTHLYPNRRTELEAIPINGFDTPEICIPNMPEEIEHSGIYITAVIHKRDIDGILSSKIEFIPHYVFELDGDPDVLWDYNLDEYDIVPNSTLLITESNGNRGDSVHPVFNITDETYTASACVFSQEILNDLRIPKEVANAIDWEESLKEMRKYYPNPDVYITDTESKSFFKNAHAIVQNTDYYYKRLYEADLNASMTITTDYFYDDPSHNKFRISINGHRVDHGTDYTTDIRMVEGYMRGSPIKITFNKHSTTVNNAIADNFVNFPRMFGKLLNGYFYELLEGQDESNYRFSNTPIEPDPNTIYYDIPNNLSTYYWNGGEFVTWDGKTHFGSSGRVKSVVSFEFLPYKDRVVWKSKALTNREVTVLREVLERPLSFAYFDFYLDGIKLTADKLEIVSARRFRFAPNVNFSGKTITIYERCHDHDIYGNADYLPESIDDVLANRLPEYAQYLYGTNP